MAKRKKNSLPKRIYVKQEEADSTISEPYLIADESLDSMNDGDTVGIYELKDTRTMHVSRDLK